VTGRDVLQEIETSTLFFSKGSSNLRKKSESSASIGKLSPDIFEASSSITGLGRVRFNYLEGYHFGNAMYPSDVDSSSSAVLLVPGKY
jgi:hypothetical protein